eukprot:Selendium_serpulae@DN9588_c0_g1_i1.p2
MDEEVAALRRLDDAAEVAELRRRLTAMLQRSLSDAPYRLALGAAPLAVAELWAATLRLFAASPTGAPSGDAAGQRGACGSVLLRLLRNLCAGNADCQRTLMGLDALDAIETVVAPAIVALVAAPPSEEPSGAASELTRLPAALVQLLTNLATANPAAAEAVLMRLGSPQSRLSLLDLVLIIEDDEQLPCVLLLLNNSVGAARAGRVDTGALTVGVAALLSRVLAAMGDAAAAKLDDATRLRALFDRAVSARD